MTEMDYLTHFLSKSVYNDVLCINGSRVTALNVFLQPQRLQYPYTPASIWSNLDSGY